MKLNEVDEPRKSHLVQSQPTYLTLNTLKTALAKNRVSNTSKNSPDTNESIDSTYEQKNVENKMLTGIKQRIKQKIKSEMSTVSSRVKRS